MMAQAKLIFTDGLPFKIKEYLVRERNFHQFSLQQTITEARRHSNVSQFLNKGGGGKQWPENSNSNSNNNSKSNTQGI